MALHVQLATVRLRIPGCQSLKDKRQVIRSLLASLHRRFNVSAAEVDCLDAWQSAVIAMTAVSNETSHLSQVIAASINYIESEPRLVLVAVETEQL